MMPTVLLSAFNILCAHVDTDYALSTLCARTLKGSYHFQIKKENGGQKANLPNQANG